MTSRTNESAAESRKSQSLSQYPPSKYASDLAICSGVSLATYASVAATGSSRVEAEEVAATELFGAVDCAEASPARARTVVTSAVENDDCSAHQVLIS